MVSSFMSKLTARSDAGYNLPKLYSDNIRRTRKPNIDSLVLGQLALSEVRAQGNSYRRTRRIPPFVRRSWSLLKNLLCCNC
jgi:hypothetical protein